MRSLLSIPLFYRIAQNVIRGREAYRIIAGEYIRARENDRVLDIGCGPADLLAYLPHVEYIGFDVNESFVEAANRRFGKRGTFIHCSVSRAAIEELGPGSFDLVLGHAIVHHLDDEEAIRFFELAQTALKPGGRLITVDGCFVVGQSRIARFLLARDRGRHVRTKEKYVELATRVFSKVRAEVRHDIFRFPYTLILIEANQ